VKRAGIFLFFDPQGLVDDYIVECLTSLREYLDEILVQPTVALQVADRDHGHGVGVGELSQLVAARHGAVVVDDLHEDAHGAVARQAHEVDGGLGVTAAREDPALACTQGEDVAGVDEVGRY